MTTLVLALAVPLNLLVVGAIWQLASGAAETQRTGLLYTARTVAAAVDAHLGKYVGMGQSLANSPALLRDDLRAFAAEAYRAFPPSSDAWLLVADLDGRQLFNTARQPDQPLPLRHPHALEAQQRAIEKRSLIIADDIVIGPLTQSWVATMEIPVFKDGRPFRVLAVAAKMEGFQKLLSEHQMPAGWLAGIIDQEGRLLARVPQPERYVGQLASEGWRKIKEGDGVFEFHSLEGNEIVQGNAHPSLAANWTIGIGVPKNQLQSAAWRTVRWATLLGAALSGLSLLLALFIARRISSPIAELRQNIAPLLEGSASNFRGGAPEVTELTEALRSAAAERKRGEEASQRLAAIVRSSFDAIISKKLDGTVTSWNASAHAMFGYTAEEMIGESIRRLIPPDKQKEEDEIIQQLTANQRVETLETIRIRKDGHAIPVSITISPLTDATGAVIGASKVARDISDRKAREEQVQILLRELNHRSKNVLAVVQAIAHRTAAGSSPEFLERFSQRLRALAVNQDLLTNNEWHGIDLGALIKAQLAPFADVGTRVRALGPSVRLSAAAAQAIGMAVHELATNASKYGALSTDQGSIDVTWAQDQGTFTLRWSEHDGPPVQAPKSEGFGTLVLSSMVEQAVEGDVAIDYAPSGLTWRLSCDVDRVLDGAGWESSP